MLSWLFTTKSAWRSAAVSQTDQREAGPPGHATQGGQEPRSQRVQGAPMQSILCLPYPLLRSTGLKIFSLSLSNPNPNPNPFDGSPSLHSLTSRSTDVSEVWSGLSCTSGSQTFRPLWLRAVRARFMTWLCDFSLLLFHWSPPPALSGTAVVRSYVLLP